MKNTFFSFFFPFVPSSLLLQSLDSSCSNDGTQRIMVYILKPDIGSSSRKIELIRPREPCKSPKYLVIAQEYIEPFLLDNTKSDLCIDVLIADVDRNGIARFCSAKSGESVKSNEIRNSQSISEDFARLNSKEIGEKAQWKHGIQYLWCPSIVDTPRSHLSLRA
jgi:hypothetical protein